MPRRDVVLTGLVAFAAGCAVGANWPKIRKKIGPLVGKAGMQISELGELLSETFPEAESFFRNGAADGHAAAKEAFGTKRATTNGVHENGVHENGQNGHTRANGSVKRPTTRRKTSPRKPVEPSVV